MSTPPNWQQYGQQQGWQPPTGAGQQTRAPRGGNERSTQFHFHVGGPNAGPGMGGGAAGGIGAPRGGGAGGGQGAAGGRTHSPLGDPEFFTNADVRAFCEKGRSAFLQLSFELAMAAEVLQAVLKEVPDPDGRPFGSQSRARRVAKHLKKAADDAKDAAANAARTYAAFQKEFDPQLSRVARPRQQRRAFDFGG
ncbi:sporulation protein SsgA [Kitasatospora sp. NBC_00070]|uniref:plasmid transfer protein TraA n=1 Tax=Kitasatospora sp. NBC_00070 TaxID=2975962 RepID=UPI00324C3DDF